MAVLYREIEDVQKLKKLNSELTRRIVSQVPYRKQKVVGYPSGRAEISVQFERRSGTHVRWWSSHPSQDRSTMINLVGVGDPDSESYLLIDLQFSIPIADFDRKHGGAFVEELSTGRMFLAHRGIVSRGKSRVKREDLLRETTHEMSSVATAVGHVDLFIVAPLDSSTLFDDIARFGQEIRRAAKVAMGEESRTSESASNALSSGNSSLIDQRLNAYFDEFEGVRRIAARRASKAFVQHGSVVRQLADALQPFRLQKSKFIDLSAEGNKDVCVYEVKTSFNPASIYMAIGQLSLHAVACSKLFGKKPIRKVLVLPNGVSDEFKSLMLRDLDIDVLCFTRKGNGGVEFDRIDEVCPKG